eukprot:355754-Chlamydomonas_euryale.AAC.9
MNTKKATCQAGMPRLGARRSSHQGRSMSAAHSSPRSIASLGFALCRPCQDQPSCARKCARRRMHEVKGRERVCWHSRKSGNPRLRRQVANRNIESTMAYPHHARWWCGMRTTP